MGELKITANGDYRIAAGPDVPLGQHTETTVSISENSASATLLFGRGDANGNFVAYAEGAITDDSLIQHGKETKLMVRVSDISANSVTIGFFEGN